MVKMTQLPDDVSRKKDRYLTLWLATLEALINNT